jgi:hypothetical protein
VPARFEDWHNFRYLWANRKHTAKIFTMRKLLIALAATAVFASCHNNADNAAAIESAKQATIDSMNVVNAEKERAEHETKASKKRSTAAAPAASSENSTASSGAAAPAPAKKKGWSHTAKGAVVGAGAGAITGAVVNKNDRVKGAAIGTIVGAGMGAGIGAIVDHEKKKKEAAKQ